MQGPKASASSSASAGVWQHVSQHQAQQCPQYQVLVPQATGMNVPQVPHYQAQFPEGGVMYAPQVPHYPEQAPQASAPALPNIIGAMLKQEAVVAQLETHSNRTNELVNKTCEDLAGLTATINRDGGTKNKTMTLDQTQIVLP